MKKLLLSLMLLSSGAVLFGAARIPRLVEDEEYLKNLKYTLLIQYLAKGLFKLNTWGQERMIDSTLSIARRILDAPNDKSLVGIDKEINSMFSKLPTEYFVSMNR